MSILIKGAEKPDHCLLCFAFRNGICAVAKKEVVLSKGVQEWCPLVEIPLKSVPAADVVEVRHGRWIGKTYKCSLCGKWVDPLQGDADMNYCPNCGAKMDGEE